MSLGPLELARLALHLKVLMAFRTAEAEGTSVIANEGNAFGGVDRAGAEVAGFDPGSIRSKSAWTF